MYSTSTYNDLLCLGNNDTVTPFLIPTVLYLDTLPALDTFHDTCCPNQRKHKGREMEGEMDGDMTTVKKCGGACSIITEKV